METLVPALLAHVPGCISPRSFASDLLVAPGRAYHSNGRLAGGHCRGFEEVIWLHSVLGCFQPAARMFALQRRIFSLCISYQNMRSERYLPENDVWVYRNPFGRESMYAMEQRGSDFKLPSRCGPRLRWCGTARSKSSPGNTVLPILWDPGPHKKKETLVRWAQSPPLSGFGLQKIETLQHYSCQDWRYVLRNCANHMTLPQCLS